LSRTTAVTPELDLAGFTESSLLTVGGFVDPRGAGQWRRFGVLANEAFRVQVVGAVQRAGAGFADEAGSAVVDVGGV